jgi:drug/metabolite transporter (DMT)-like permease
MRPADILRLTALAAIWGGSFAFMRALAPVLGPVLTAGLRVTLGGLVLLALFRVLGVDLQARARWRQYALLGLLNTALPFLLYSWAALHIPASLMVILNSTAPLFGALCAARWLGERLTPAKLAGIALGIGGVAMVSGIGPALAGAHTWAAIAACLCASACYGLAGTYVKLHAREAKPQGIAALTQLWAGAALLPLTPLAPPAGPFTALVALNLLGLALLCSAVAYLLYFKLIADVGPSKALTVAFLMPPFGMLWGALFLGEAITTPMLLGCALILAGTGLVLRTQAAHRAPEQAG